MEEFIQEEDENEYSFEWYKERIPWSTKRKVGTKYIFKITPSLKDRIPDSDNKRINDILDMSY